MSRERRDSHPIMLTSLHGYVKDYVNDESNCIDADDVRWIKLFFEAMHGLDWAGLMMECIRRQKRNWMKVLRV